MARKPLPPAVAPVAAPAIAEIGTLMRRGAAKLRATDNAPDAARLEQAATDLARMLRGDISAARFAADWFGPGTDALARIADPTEAGEEGGKDA